MDGHDPDAVAAAFDEAVGETSRPSLICCKTTIGKGSPNKEGTESCHGAPLGADEIALTREALGWGHDPFVVPDDVYAHWDARTSVPNWAAWQSLFDAYKRDCPELPMSFSVGWLANYRPSF